MEVKTHLEYVILIFVTFSFHLRLSRDKSVVTGRINRSTRQKPPASPKSLVTFLLAPPRKRQFDGIDFLLTGNCHRHKPPSLIPAPHSTAPSPRGGNRAQLVFTAKALFDIIGSAQNITCVSKLAAGSSILK